MTIKERWDHVVLQNSNYLPNELHRQGIILFNSIGRSMQ